MSPGDVCRETARTYLLVSITYMRACEHVCIHAYEHTYMRACEHVCIHVCEHVCILANAHICMRACEHYIHVCV